MADRRGKGLYVEVFIAVDVDLVWELSQNTVQHPRWDLRFSRISPAGSLPGGGYTFDYERRLPGHTIRGVGTSIGEKIRADGTRTSALRFSTRDRLSPLRSGIGYWRYIPTDGGVRFITGYE